MKFSAGISLGLLLLLAGCKKDPRNEDGEVNIIVFSGDHQSATIGTALKDSLVIMVDCTDRLRLYARKDCSEGL